MMPEIQKFSGMHKFLLYQKTKLYEYKNLEQDEIRIIELKPASEGKKLTISFHHINLSDSKGSYEALSYYWGASVSPNVVDCGDSFLEITSNLESALLNLRLDSENRFLWVDAICINQNDLNERSQQVILMRNIYQSCKQCLVYLGDESEDSSLASRYLGDFFIRWVLDTAIQEAETGEKVPLAVSLYSMASSSEKLFNKFNEEQVQKAIVNLTCREWFRRVWVIQEFVVSPNVAMYCGKDRIEWASFIPIFAYAFPKAGINWEQVLEENQREDFFRYVHIYFQRKNLTIRSGVALMLQMQDMRNNFDPSSSFVKLLSRTRSARATKPVDKIFALMSLCDEKMRLKPDYFSSKAAIYTQTATMISESGKHIHLTLYESGCSDHNDSTIPSWVPDWTEPPKRINLGRTWPKSGWAFSASGSSDSLGENRIEGNKLFVQGAVIQTVTVVGRDHLTQVKDAPILSHLFAVLDDFLYLSEEKIQYPTGENINEVLHEIMVANQKDNVITTSLWEDKWSRDILWEPEVSKFQYIKNQVELTELEMFRSQNSNRFRNICRAVAGRRMIWTNDGYIGLAPSKTQAGDKVCVFRGFTVPFVLRRTNDNNYKLIGDCYLHGVMFGEQYDESAMKEITIC